MCDVNEYEGGIDFSCTKNRVFVYLLDFLKLDDKCSIVVNFLLRTGEGHARPSEWKAAKNSGFIGQKVS